MLIYHNFCINEGEKLRMDRCITNNNKIHTAERSFQCNKNNSEKSQCMLYSSGFKQEKTTINVNGKVIGGKNLAIIAGPCAIDSEEQFYETAKEVEKAGAQFLRGAIYKPRTSPYNFQGIGDRGLKILKNVKNYVNLAIISEALDVAHLEKLAEVADIIQIGARNMHNFELLKAVGQMRKPILLKRGLCATIQEWLMSAEYILLGGNSQVILCERGIRTFETATRNTIDISSVPIIKNLSHLPIIVDPSHGTGQGFLVEPMAKAAIAAGADGLMVEVYISPERAISDKDQTISTEEFSRLVCSTRKVATAIGKVID